MPPGIGMMKSMFGVPTEFLAAELIYFIFVVSICFLIYLKTRDMYKLTKHEGIYFFRKTFLYFGLAYFFRFFYLIPNLFFDLPRHTFFRGSPHLNMMIMAFFSTLAILSLAMTFIIRNVKLDARKMNIYLHIISLFVVFLVLFTASYDLIFVVQSLIMLFISVYAFISKEPHEGKKISYNKLMYVSIFILWVINVFAFNRFLLPITYRFALYIVSIIVFLSIFLRLRRRLNPHAKKKR